MAAVETKTNGNILEVKNLKTYFFTEDGVVKSVDGVDFAVRRGEVMGLVGESGCGKSVTSLSIMRLIGMPGKTIEGEIVFDGQDLLKLAEADMVHIRGNRISMIFQQPQSSLNPVFRVGDQIAEVLDIHRSLGKEDGWRRAIDLLKMVGISDAERRATAFPHELSGGMAQRVAVMYAGQIVEQTDVKTLFAEPKHPYTQGLIGSIPVLGIVKDELDTIPGSVPNLVNLPSGCRFAPRCRFRVEHNLTICTDKLPDLKPVAPDHLVRCWLYHSAAGWKITFEENRMATTSQLDWKVEENGNKKEDLVEVKNLVKYFPVRGGLLQRVVAWVQAV